MGLRLPKDRILHFTKQVEQSSIAELTRSIVDIEEDDTYLKGLYGLHGLEYKPLPIKIYIDSYGGQVYQCMGLIGIMERCKTPIHTIVTGVAMSCGFLITIAGHKRFCYPTSTLLYHQVSSVSGGTLKDIEDDVIEIKRLQKWFEDLTIRKTGIKKSRLKEVYKEKIDWYIPAEEALSLHVIDEIL
jgi:ATP-dependent Clp protease protease subunit